MTAKSPDDIARAIGDVWTRITGESEDAVEIAVAEYPARMVMRGGVPTSGAALV